VQSKKRCVRDELSFQQFKGTLSYSKEKPTMFKTVKETIHV